jgi:hypothetical protein
MNSHRKPYLIHSYASSIRVLLFAFALAFSTNATLLSPSPICAQEYRGTITGIVSDSTGALIPNASIIVTELSTGSLHKTISNNSGEYNVPFLLPGTYRIEAQADGFTNIIRNNVVIQAGDHPTINLSLAITGASQTVEVSADAPLIDQSNASVGQVVTTQQVADLPVSGRNPISLAQLSVGVLSVGNASQQGLFGAGNTWSIGGTPNQTSEVLLDGSPDTTWSGNLAYSPTQESIQEVSVSIFDTDASFGHTVGGVINQISKSGTNRLHGSLYEFGQISALDANTYFNDQKHIPIPVTHYNQYGLTVGGPVFIPKVFNGKDKLFFFFAWEGVHDSQPTTVENTVPTPAERVGDFSALLPLGCPSGYQNGNSAVCSNGTANPYQLYNPYSATSAGGAITRQPIPGNVLSNAGLTINPVAQSFLQFYPQANGTALQNDGFENYTSSAPSIDRYNNEFGRIDWNASARNHVFFDVRHNFRTQTKGNYFNNNATGSGLLRENYGVMVDEIFTLNSSTVFDVRANWTSYFEQHDAPSNAFSPTTVGLPALTAASEFPQLPYIGFSGSCGSFTSFQCLGDTGSGKDPTTIYQLFTDVVKVIGHHTLKAGVDLRQYRVDVINYGDSAGLFTFGTNFVSQTSSSAAPTFGGDFASFLLGLPTAGEFDQAARASFHSWYTAGFVQDDWRPTAHLTLNLGIRFDHDSPYDEKLGRTVNGFNQTAALPITGQAQANYAAQPLSYLPAASFNPVGGLTYANANNSGPYQTASHYVSPRFGFSYSPEQLHNTTIRGGFGLFVTPDTISTLAATGTYSSNAITNQEGFSSVTPLVATNNNYLTPATNLSNPFPTGFTLPTGSSLGAATNLGQTISYMAPVEHDPYSERWNLGIQHEFGSNILAEVDYVANHAVHLPVAATQMNPVPRQYLSTSPGRDQTLINAYSTSVANPFAGLLPGTTLNGSTTSIPQLLSVHPQFPTSGQGFSSGIIEQNATVGSSNFESLDAHVEKRFSKGLSLIGSYSYSKLMESTTYLNDTDTSLEHRISPFDFTEHFVAATTYDLPFGKGRTFNTHSRLLDTLFGGFTVNAIYTYQTGAPIYFSADIPLLPGYTPSDIRINNSNTTGKALNTNIFQTANASTNGGGQFQYHVRTLPQTLANIRSQPINNMDSSILKNIHFTEGTYFQLRFETFNTLNHPIFSAPAVSSATSSGFGTITTQADSPRGVQIGGRFVF